MYNLFVIEVAGDVALKDKSVISYVLLTVCTYKRPHMLKNAISSVNQLILPPDIKVEILIVDNDANESARSVISELSEALKLKIHYVVEKNRGLSNARNRAIDESINLGASHILMFDDDEVLTPNSLVSHIDLYNKNSQCNISSGIVLNKFSDDTPNYIKNSIVFKSKTKKETGQIKSYCASGNVFIPVDMVKNNNLRFSNEFVFMGGEDGDFFKRASGLGYIIVQNSESLIYEDVSKERATVRYMLRKAYTNGYCNSFIKFKTDSKSLWFFIKLIIVLFINILALIPSLLFGLSTFYNVLLMALKTYGKIVGAIKNTPCEFYKKTYGS